MSKHRRHRRESRTRRIARRQPTCRASRYWAAGAIAERNVLGLGIERLEDRLVLSGSPVLTGPTGSYVVNEGDTVNVSFEFTDTLMGGSGSVGLDPTVYDDPDTTTSFNPLVSVTINTDTFNLESPLGVVIGSLDGQLAHVNAQAGFTAYDIAVFAFDDINIPAGVTVKAVGSRPLALLSTGDITVSGKIDVSAYNDPTDPGSGIGQRLARRRRRPGRQPFVDQRRRSGGVAFQSQWLWTGAQPCGQQRSRRGRRRLRRRRRARVHRQFRHPARPCRSGVRQSCRRHPGRQRRRRGDRQQRVWRRGRRRRRRRRRVRGRQQRIHRRTGIRQWRRGRGAQRVLRRRRRGRRRGRRRHPVARR